MFEPTLKSVSGWMHKPLKLIARVLAAKNNNQEHEHYYGQADAREPTTTTTTTKEGEPCFLKQDLWNAKWNIGRQKELEGEGKRVTLTLTRRRSYFLSTMQEAEKEGPVQKKGELLGLGLGLGLGSECHPEGYPVSPPLRSPPPFPPHRIISYSSSG